MIPQVQIGRHRKVDFYAYLVALIGVVAVLAHFNAVMPEFGRISRGKAAIDHDRLI